MATYRRYRRRRYTRRPRRSQKRQWGRAGRKAGHTALRAYKLAKATRSLLNVEFGHKDDARSVTPDTTGSIYLLNGISRGDGTENRHGKQVKMKNYNGLFRITNNNANTATIVRIIIFTKWTQDNTASVVDDILDSSPAVKALNHYNLDEIKNHKILYDRMHTVNDNRPEKLVRINLPLYQKVIYSIGNTGNLVTDIEHNGLHMILISDTDVNLPTISTRERLRWIDN